MNNNHPPEPTRNDVRERAWVAAEQFPLPPTWQMRGRCYVRDIEQRPECKGMTYEQWVEWKLDQHRRWMRYPRWFRRANLPQWLRWLLWERPRQRARGLSA